MISYICKVIFVTIIEISILWGVSIFFNLTFLTVMFFGSFFFVIFAFMIGSSGDIFTKNAEVGVFRAMAGAYKPRHETLTLKVGPFLVGSILCLTISFILAFI